MDVLLDIPGIRYEKGEFSDHTRKNGLGGVLRGNGEGGDLRHPDLNALVEIILVIVQNGTESSDETPGGDRHVEHVDTHIDEDRFFQIDAIRIREQGDVREFGGQGDGDVLKMIPIVRDNEIFANSLDSEVLAGGPVDESSEMNRRCRA